MPKSTVKNNRLDVLKNRGQAFTNVIMGIGMLFAVSSIVYSTAVIVLGTDGSLPKLLVVPQALLALGIATKNFVKQGEH